MPNRTFAPSDELMPSARTMSERAGATEIAAARGYLRAEAAREPQRSWTRTVAAAFAAGLAVIALALAGNAMVNGKLAAELFAPEAPVVQGDSAPTTTSATAPASNTSGTTGSTALPGGTTTVSGSAITATQPASAGSTTSGAAASTSDGTTGTSSSSSTNTGGSTGSGTSTNTGGSTGSGTSTGTGGSGNTNLTLGPGERAATETFRVGNVAPDTAIRTDFVGGVVGDVVPVDVQSVDGNTMAGARIELCIRRSSASCAGPANGTSMARWTAVITNAAPIITAADGNGSWSLFVRSRTGTADTPSTTLGFDVTIGTDAQSANDWVVETTTVDEGGLSKTVVGAPATVSASRSRSSNSSFFSALWPF